MKKALVLTEGHASDGPYGIDKLEHFGYRLIDVPPARSGVHRKLRDFVEHRAGRPIDRTLRSTRVAAEADLIIAFLENQALTPAWLKRHGIPPWKNKPLVMFECWLAEELRHLPQAQRRSIVGRYDGVDLVFAWSSNQIDILIDSGFDTHRVASVPFGFAPELHPFVPMHERDGGIVAIGFDRGRDYATLVGAVEETDLSVTLICKRENIEGIALPENVSFLGTIPYAEYRRRIAEAEIVVVPTKDLAYPTGQTVAMEAAAAGACLVVTATAPMREYFTSDEALLVAPHDTDALRQAVTRATKDASLRARLGWAASQRMTSQFTYLQMWGQFDDALRNRGII